jgi:hypothetical protein
MYSKPVNGGRNEEGSPEVTLFPGPEKMAGPAALLPDPGPFGRKQASGSIVHEFLKFSKM